MIRTLDVDIQVIRNGAFFDHLYPKEGGAPRLRMNSSSNIPTSLSGDYALNRSINWLTDELQPVLIIDGVEHKLGRYLPATVQELTAPAPAFVHVEAYDRCWRCRDNYTTTMLYFAAGTNYLTAVQQLLVACGIEVILMTPTAETLTEGRQDWPIGTSYLAIINQLLQEINYKRLWFSSEGAAILEPVATPSAARIQHSFDSENVQSLMVPQLQRLQDIYSAPNVFICICSNPDKSGPLMATAENSNPQSPISIPRRGRRIATVVNVDNVANQTALQAYANRLLFDSMTGAETISVATALLPGFGVEDVVALHYDDEAAICVETAWDMELRPGGTMSHTLRKVVYNLESA